MENKKNKRIIKGLIISQIILVLVVVGIIVTNVRTSYALNNYLFSSSYIGYDNTESGLRSDNVQEAIGELYYRASDYSGINARVTTLEDYKNQIYPVGSIYISVNNTNPGTLFGGTWEAFGPGKTLIGVDTTDTNYNESLKTGGSKTQTLSTDNIPSHSHYYTPSGSNSGGSVSAHTYTPAGSINVVIGNHTYTPAGSVSQPTFTGTSVKTTENGSHSHTINGLNSNKNVASFYGDNKNGNWGSGNTLGSNAISIANSGAHTHNVTAAGTVSKPTFTGTQATLTHSVTTKTFTGTQATLSHTVTQPTFTGTRAQTENTGSGNAFSTMDPYITVYMWKRTA